MTNMSYCRVENTLADLKDCYNNVEPDDLSENEEKAWKELIVLCQDMVDDYKEEEE